MSGQESEKQSTKRKRAICDHCNRPTPQACICCALPTHPIQLLKSRVIVLQHPSESKRKNSSLPLTSLCLDNKYHKGTKLNAHVDVSFYTTVARWWGEEVVEPEIWKLVNDEHEPVLICFPSDEAVTLEEALLKISKLILPEVAKNEETIQHSDDAEMHTTPKINIIFIDATWKYAKEMVSKTIQNGGWPSHSINVKLEPTKDFGENFKARRFDIRTPPSVDHLSTAECIAHVLREVEGRSAGNEVFDTLMRPLDLMVQQWHSFQDSKKKLKKSTDETL